MGSGRYYHKCVCALMSAIAECRKLDSSNGQTFDTRNVRPHAITINLFLKFVVSDFSKVIFNFACVCTCACECVHGNLCSRNNTHRMPPLRFRLVGGGSVIFIVDTVAAL